MEPLRRRARGGGGGRAVGGGQRGGRGGGGGRGCGGGGGGGGGRARLRRGGAAGDRREQGSRDRAPRAARADRLPHRRTARAPPRLPHSALALAHCAVRGRRAARADVWRPSARRVVAVASDPFGRALRRGARQLAARARLHARRAVAEVAAPVRHRLLRAAAQWPHPPHPRAAAAGGERPPAADGVDVLLRAPPPGVPLARRARGRKLDAALDNSAGFFLS